VGGVNWLGKLLFCCFLYNIIVIEFVSNGFIFQKKKLYILSMWLLSRWVIMEIYQMKYFSSSSTKLFIMYFAWCLCVSTHIQLQTILCKSVWFIMFVAFYLISGGWNLLTENHKNYFWVFQHPGIIRKYSKIQ